MLLLDLDLTRESGAGLAAEMQPEEAPKRIASRSITAAFALTSRRNTAVDYSLHRSASWKPIGADQECTDLSESGTGQKFTQMRGRRSAEATAARRPGARSGGEIRASLESLGGEAAGATSRARA